VFKLAGDERLFAASFALARPGEVQWVEKQSHHEVEQSIHNALLEKFPAPGDGVARVDWWIVDVYDQFAVFEREGKAWRVPYTYENNEATLQGEPEHVVRTYVSADEAAAVQQVQQRATDQVQKPFAGFKTFGECLASQQSAGKDETAARNICGALQRDAEKALSDKDVRMLKREVRLLKADEQDHRYVLGIVLEPDIVDAQGDTYSVEEVQTAAHDFMERFRNVGLMHKGLVNERVRILESWVTKVDQTIGDVLVKAGTWLMSARVVDDELWDCCKRGEFTGWSIGGSAIRTAEAA
jgi:hypothetical protein